MFTKIYSMSLVMLGNRFYVASADYGLVVEYLEDGIEFAVSGNGRAGKEVILGQDLVRFVGACFSAGYGIDGFEKEVINGLYIEPDRIRVLVSGSLNDRAFVKVKPEHLIELAYISLHRYYPKEGKFSIMEYELSYALSPKGMLLKLKDKERQESVFVEKAEIALLIGVIETSFVGRLVGSGRVSVEKGKKVLYVDEIVEPKADPNTVLTDYLTTKEGKQEVSKPLYAWLVYLRDLAKEHSRSPSGVIRSFLRKHGINYDRKILFSVGVSRDKRVQVRLPIHFAKGLSLLLQRWLYGGA